MKKSVIVLLLLVMLLFLPLILATSVDSEMQKLTHYAEEYETGNIDYVKLRLHMSSVRESLNEIFGATNKEMGGVVKQEQIRKILGEPNEETKWVWVEGGEHDIKLDSSVPIWKKIIFDGKKIQIRFEAFPSIFKKNAFDDFENNLIEDGSLIYRLNFNVEFKRAQEQLDIQGKINEIQSLAEAFNADPSNSNAEELAKQSVNAQRAFENVFRQSQGKCEDLMSSIFGSENKRQSQQILLNEINFYGGDNFEAIMRMEMCDDCEWNWININMRIEGRGPGFKPPKNIEESQENYREKYKGTTDEEFESETKKLVSEIKRFLESGDYGQAISSSNRLRMLTEAWNEKANDVWQQIEKDRIIEQPKENNDPYWWIKQDQLQRKKAEELRKINYEKRKTFYLNLFSDYEKKEFYFQQEEWEKRLIQEFKERGEEICNNHVDDNNNEKVDCEDDQCGGVICGRGTEIINNENETIEQEVDFYCVSGTCQAKEEIMKVVIFQNFTVCEELTSLKCKGDLIFSEYDSNKCPIEQKCIEETIFCEANEDCKQPNCGIAECVEGICKVTGFKECKEGCVDGSEEVCGGIVFRICLEGIWKETGEECLEDIQGISVDDTSAGQECFYETDCGKGNYVCSNGHCNLIADNIIEIEVEGDHESQGVVEGEARQNIEEENEGGASSIPEETPSEESEEITGEEASSEPIETTPESSSESEETSAETNSEPEETISGNIIFGLIQGLVNKLKVSAFVITRFGGEEGNNSGENSVDRDSSDGGNSNFVVEDSGDDSVGAIDATNDGEEEKSSDDNIREEGDENKEENRDFQDDSQGQRDDSVEWKEGDKERREKENKERCKKECVRPCVEKCIREDCGDAMDCDIDAKSKECENGCSADDNCVEKCIGGGDWWKEFEEEYKEEKGVFQVGGGCRKEQGRTEGFIWFGGWGDPFERIEPLKQKYYQGGEADWCKYDLENLIKQREEFEKGFNQEFAIWFFEKYLPNSAENWEQSVSGIFELYWTNVENQMQIAQRMKCLEKNNIGELMNVNLIQINYNTDYGSIEYWEELKEVKIPGMDEKVTVVSPYMKVWIFPSKDFIKYEMKTAMEKHEFPSSPEEKLERKNQEGLTAEQKEKIREDKKEMEMIKKMAEKYGGSLDLVIQFKDYEKDEIVFNLFAQINEKDIMKVEPMLPSEVPEKDVIVEMDFALFYEMIYIMEKDMQGVQIESPPWDKKLRPIQKIKEIGNGIKMWNKLRALRNSEKISPSEDEKTISEITGLVMDSMMRGPNDKQDDMEKDKEGGNTKNIFENKDMSGKVILQ